MTIDQLNEANRLRSRATATANLSKEFSDVNEYRSIIFFPTKTTVGINPTEIKLHGNVIMGIADRPEVRAAADACILLMRAALEAEAKRHADAFDAFTITD